jgi:hypothetical protein
VVGWAIAACCRAQAFLGGGKHLPATAAAGAAAPAASAATSRRVPTVTYGETGERIAYASISS